MVTVAKNDTKLFEVTIKAPASLPDEVLQRIILDAVNAEAKKRPAAPKKTRVTLYNRTTRAKGAFPCRLEPKPLHAKAITWPAGVPHQGCGRTFSSAAMRDAHEAGFTDVARTKAGWISRSFPNQCLDRIVPAHLRDTR